MPIPRFNKKTLFLATMVLLAGVNTWQLLQAIQTQQRVRRIIPFNFLGTQFEGLQDIVQGADIIGYYTDKPIDNDHKANLAQFQQAQYTLAPIVLDLNNVAHPFVFFDCTNPANALSKIKQLNFTPVKVNKTGIILAINRNMERLR